jgi:hypothetical protein
MKTLTRIIGFVALTSLSQVSWSQEMSCEQIRSEISAQSEARTTANTDLLRKISGRTDCRFTGPEVYRAAFGTKPLPKEEPRKAHRHEDDDD